MIKRKDKKWLKKNNIKKKQNIWYKKKLNEENHPKFIVGFNSKTAKKMKWKKKTFFFE